jgi:hypothetical protein
MQVRVIAPELENDGQIERAHALGCDGYTLRAQTGVQDA